MAKIILSLSGGLDSCVLLAKAVSEGHKIQCVGFLYGSKHNRYELEAAEAITGHYKVRYDCIDLSVLTPYLRSKLLEGQGDLPEGHYEEESMRQTVVPGRNTIFASVLLGLAQSQGYDEVWLGIHAGDHFIYPDCRPDWFYAMQRVSELGSDKLVTLKVPFLHIDKTEILARGLKLDAPFRLTRTCYTDKPYACGRCGSCQERLHAFVGNGRQDPLPYVSSALIPKENQS